MSSFGMIVAILGTIGLIWGIMQKIKAGRVVDAPLVSTGEVAQRGSAVAGPKGQISAQGGVSCQQPLISPVTGTPCFYYHVKTVAAWEDNRGKHVKCIDDQHVAAQLSIDDGTGPAWIDAGKGGDFEPTQKKEQTKGAGIVGGLTGADVMFGDYRVAAGNYGIGAKFTVVEEVLPVVARLFACGRLASSGNVIEAPGWRSLILSAKSRDELLASATKGAKVWLIAGAAALVVGSGVAIAAPRTEKAAPAAVAAKEAPRFTTPSATTPTTVASIGSPALPVAVSTTRTTSATSKSLAPVVTAAKSATPPKADASKADASKADAGAPKAPATKPK